ncbi:MAG TPA: AfsA-related hotdog domain-containing protein [Amycolatopsis sp.]|nr:AfsA-related hotdog domain-containing protein [Amycolatopsis sp.]
MSETGSPRVISVVGDRFRDFAESVGAWSLSELVAAITEGEFDEGPWPLRILTGQGIDDYSGTYLLAALTRRGVEEAEVSLLRSEEVIADRHELHKGQAHNVLVANLTAETPEVFTADLRLHNDNELVVDAQTRPHVQGMVAVEAARQMFVAVTERFFLSRTPGRRYYLVINAMNTTFKNFLFPVGATLRLTVLQADLDRPEQLVFSHEVVIEQAGRPAAVTRIDFAAIDLGVIDDKEQRRAKQTLASVLENSAAAR